METKKEFVFLEKRGNVAKITLNDPKRKNCLSEQMCREIISTFEELRNDDSIRVVTTTGTGDAFCVGMDLHDLQRYYEHPETEAESSVPKMHAVIRTFPKLTIAVVNGYALGAGFHISLSHDLTIASEEKAQFGLSEILRGFLPKYVLGTLLKYVPVKVAFDITLTGENWDAKKAQAGGLVTRVVPHKELQEAAFQWAKLLAQWDPITMNYCKKCLHEGMDETVEGARLLSAYYHEQNLKYNPRHHKGLVDFLAKKGVKADLKSR